MGFTDFVYYKKIEVSSVPTKVKLYIFDMDKKLTYLYFFTFPFVKLI